MALKLQAGPHFSHKIIGANISDGTVIAIAASVGLAVAGSGIPVIDTSKQSTLHLDDTTPLQIATAGAPATVAAPTRSLSQTSSFALRCIARVSWSAAPGAIAYVQGATW